MTTISRAGFRRKERGPDRGPFVHADGCPILRADPDVEIPWSETERGRWERVCRCTSEVYYEPAPKRVRLDPLDPKTSRHLPHCEFASESDPAVLRLALKVKDGMGPGYWWVTCQACDVSWQVPHYAESVG
jgi:hypothetical protein